MPAGRGRGDARSRAAGAEHRVAPALGGFDDRIGRYEVRALLGAGGMGAVYEAYDASLDRSIALKVLRPAPRHNVSGLADRLVRESRLMAKVVHPAVITVYDVGRDDDVVFIAMELIRGRTLGRYLATNRLDWRSVVALFERAGLGLAAAHAAGIVHRDFKPENVLVDDGARRVVVSDFGLARAIAVVDDQQDTSPGAPSSAGDDLRLTASGTVIGTPAYAAPEQLAGRPADHRADVFAFSVSLWEALFGERPFPGNTAAETYAAMQAPPKQPDAPRVPRRLVRALEIGLARSPGDRWTDMSAMCAELAAIRARRARIALAAAVATAMTGLATAAVLALGRPAGEVHACSRGLDRLAAAYNPLVASAVDGALASDPDARAAVHAKLDATATAWRATQLTTCRSDREPVQPATTAACLEARRVELDGVADEIATGGREVARHATRLTLLLGDPSLCAAPPPGVLLARVPEDRALRRKVTALRLRGLDAQDARDRAEFPRALEAAQQLVSEAAAVWPLVHAEVLYLLGTIHMQGGDAKLARAALRDAVAVAERAHYDYVAASAWNQLVYQTTFMQGDPARALEYASYAEAAAERIGRPPNVVGVLSYMKGAALVQAGRSREAEAAFRAAIEIAETSESQSLGTAIQGLGYLYENQGRYADAAATYRQVLDHIARSPEGRSNNEPTFRRRLAFNLAWLGRAGEAEVEARRAIEIADRMLPDNHPDRAAVHGDLAQVLQVAGRNAEALAENTRALAALAKGLGERNELYGEYLELQGRILAGMDHPSQAAPLLARACDIIAFATDDDSAARAQCELDRCFALARLHRSAEVLARLEPLITTLIKQNGEQHPTVGDAILMRGDAHAALGHRAAAIRDYERAIASFAAAQLDPGHLAAARAALGQALWPQDRARGYAEVAAALTLFGGATPLWAKERAQAASWLSHHHKP